MTGILLMICFVFATGLVASLDRGRGSTLATDEELFGTWALQAFRRGEEALIDVEHKEWILRLSFAPGRTFLLSEWKDGKLNSERGIFLAADEMLTLIGSGPGGRASTHVQEASYRLWEDRLTLSQEDPSGDGWQVYVFERMT